MNSTPDKAFALLVLHNKLDAWCEKHQRNEKQNWQRIENTQKTLQLHEWKRTQQSWLAGVPMLRDEIEKIARDQNKQKIEKKLREHSHTAKNAEKQHQEEKMTAEEKQLTAFIEITGKEASEGSDDTAG